MFLVPEGGFASLLRFPLFYSTDLNIIFSPGFPFCRLHGLTLFTWWVPGMSTILSETSPEFLTQPFGGWLGFFLNPIIMYNPKVICAAGSISEFISEKLLKHLGTELKSKRQFWREMSLCV